VYPEKRGRGRAEMPNINPAVLTRWMGVQPAAEMKNVCVGWGLGGGGRGQAEK
jgi:hypothetical protein